MYTQRYQELVEQLAAMAPDVAKANQPTGGEAAKVRLRRGLLQHEKGCKAFRDATKEPTTPTTEQ